MAAGLTVVTGIITLAVGLVGNDVTAVLIVGVLLVICGIFGFLATAFFRGPRSVGRKNAVQRAFARAASEFAFPLQQKDVVIYEKAGALVIDCSKTGKGASTPAPPGSRNLPFAA